MAGRKKTRKTKKNKTLYGIGEWYGERYLSLTNEERKRFSQVKNTEMTCPFFEDVPALGPKSGKKNCNKKGGVCSIRNFIPLDDSSDEISFGPITATCPNRFLEAGTIVKRIGMELLGTEAPLFAKEIPFLMRPKNISPDVELEPIEDEDAQDEAITDTAKENVGRIDLVFVHPDDGEKWCAVEMQAVYFSGGEMSKDYPAIRSYSGNGIPMPGAVRRPDFRSSGPKRLMPQLMIKVPTLRRWGKKMVVVVDKPFFDAMDKMEPVEHISNCDIVWVVVRFDEDVKPGEAVLNVDRTLYTTLEDAVKGLTAGEPTTLPEFEGKLRGKVKEALPSPTFNIEDEGGHLTANLSLPEE